MLNRREAVHSELDFLILPEMVNPKAKLKWTKYEAAGLKRMGGSRSSQSQGSVGQLAEDFVAHWLQQQGWQILAQRWHCRWGELDIVAIDPSTQPCLVFVEVKARRRSNWDADGLLAITPTKREKLEQAAQLFLVAHESLVELPCRFDVAAVRVDEAMAGTSAMAPTLAFPERIELGRSVQIDNYQLTLHHYITGAFDAS